MKNNKDGSNINVVKVKRGYRLAFFMAFSISLIAELLMFFYSQTSKLSDEVSKDFNVLVTADFRLSKSEISDTEYLLRSLQGVEDVTFVSKTDRLEKLKEEDPDLVSSVINSTSNPLPDTWELKVKNSVLGNMERWVSSVWQINGVADVKYKHLEGYAVMHLLFYKHIIAVTLSLSVLSLIFVSFLILAKNDIASLRESLNNDKKWILAGFFGSLSGIFVTFFLLYPVRFLSDIWAWPSVFGQLLLVFCCALFGWVLRRWKYSR